MDRWEEPARELPIIARPDVVVVGGGSAGIAAAIASAEAGADTWLVEGSTMLGGLATFGLINLLLTMDDGAGRQVVAGLCQDFVDRMAARGAAIHPEQDEWNSEDAVAVDRWRRLGLIWGAAPEAVRYSVAFDPEAFVDVAVDRLHRAGVHLRLGTWFSTVAVDDGRAHTIVIESKSGREALRPGAVVDATGDGDVLARAGAPMELTPTPPHSWFRVGGVDTSGPAAGFWFETTDPGRALVPFGPLPDRVDATDAEQLTAAIVAGRRGAAALFETLRSSNPAFHAAWLDDHCRMLGITESRRLVGDHVLSKEEDGQTFPDGIALTGHWTKRGAVYDIPVRSLTTPSLANLLAAGRCISTTRYVHQATKEIPAAMATGEAAGVLAARAATGRDVHDIDVGSVRAELAARGAVLSAPHGPADRQE